MRSIASARLRLVPVTAQNAGALWEVLQEPDLRDFQDLPDLDETRFLRSVASRPSVLKPSAVGRFEWLVFFAREQSGEALGWVSLRISERTPTAAEIGYSVVRAYRGRGIATEAVGALVTEGFTHAKLRRMRAYCVPENAASRAVLRRNSFEDEGVVKHGATVQGQPVDVVAHSLTRERWESVGSQPSESRGHSTVTPASRKPA